MTRKPRVHFSGASYHVMSRGNQGQVIFKDDRDRHRFLDIFKESQKRVGYRLYSTIVESFRSSRKFPVAILIVSI
jgi:putative transposase